ncbi:vacuolar fusion protein ccz1 [Kickxella alabastrina]|nr:vacuolar fusion protein ccz1 [Kickxella alabastrina]
MDQTYPAALSHFAVFCPELGQEEDTSHEQLLFYSAASLPAFYPSTPNDYFSRSSHLRRNRRHSGDNHNASRTPPAAAVATAVAGTAGERVVSLDTKLREIGLATALVAFARTFTGNQSRFHTVRSEKRRTVVYEPEQGILVQLSVVLPRRVAAYGKEKGAFAVEFLDHALDDSAMRQWLAQEWAAFILLFGGGNLAERARTERRAVRRQLDSFFGRTLGGWDCRWERELHLVGSLAPVPRVRLGAISLGGFDEFWRDLSALENIAGVVVLWRAEDVVWESMGGDANAHWLRAVVAWARAVYAPAFVEVKRAQAVEVKRVPAAEPKRVLAVEPKKAQAAAAAAGSTGSWLWGWAGGGNGNGNGSGNVNSGVESASGDSSGTESSAGSAIVPRGGIAQALSRAVDALVEPRPPTPPETDPALESTSPHQMAEQYTISAADLEALESTEAAPAPAAVEPDAQSLRSVGSRVSVRTTATVAAPAVMMARSINVTASRARANTTQSSAMGVLMSSWQQHQPSRAATPRHVRAPSAMSNYSTATAESTQVLREDTRVSARSWWPQWTWGSSNSGSSTATIPAVPPVPRLPQVLETACASGVDPTTTFLYTGEHAFPGMPAGDSSAAARQPSDSTDSAGSAESSAATRSRLGLAMEDDMPPAYEHGVGVDSARGITLAPRALTGMLYDSRLLRLLYTTTAVSASASAATAAGSSMPEHPLYMPHQGSGPCKLFVYKYGDMLFLVLGRPSTDTAGNADDNGGQVAPDCAHGGGRREQQQRRRKSAGRRKARKSQLAKEALSAIEAERIEGCILRYAESLHATTVRDLGEPSKLHNLPPFVYVEDHTLVQANWLANVPVNQSFNGYAAGSLGVAASTAGVSSETSSDVRVTLGLVNGELTRSCDEICVRMQNKGWVSGMSNKSDGDSVCFCVVDQPKATLADARTFLHRVMNQAKLSLQ